MSHEKQYARRDTEELGEHYMRHLNAMTAEQLHDKNAIAAELAWRDREIARLRDALDARWIKASERLPEKQKWLIAIIGEEQVVLKIRYFRVAGNDYWDDGQQSFQIAPDDRWQPLPKPPKEQP